MTATEFGYSLNRLSPSLRPVALRLTRDQEHASELIQETVYKAFTNREKFTDGTNLKAWMLTIMKNTFITNYHKMIRRSGFLYPTDSKDCINSMRNSVENGAFSEFAITDIKKAIRHLDDMYRKPFLLYLNGFKYHEISYRLNIPLGTVKNRIHIARKELKNFLKMYANK